MIASGRVPTTLHEARDKFADSELAKSAFGEDVVRHYVRAAEVELAAYDGAVLAVLYAVGIGRPRR